MPRPTAIDPSTTARLSAGDRCWHLGEYTAKGGFGVSETNQQILNLKKHPGSSPAELRHKSAAVRFWARQIVEIVAGTSLVGAATFVPTPCSKLPTNPAFDDRMHAVLGEVRSSIPALDVRRIIVTSQDRAAQHASGRLTIDELKASMRINAATTVNTVRSVVIVVDDVFTTGRTFVAMKSLLKTIPTVTEVRGLFCARTVWPNAADAEF